ncbi:MAG: sn-glycerol-1-phosphate dehydrogenase [Treponema sp.]|jgi:glycerol-1-phosphate dehydrogenase [NAD(P)+]|nr:sn-glycerol-1-phosphate dehydrogenase [Treponema sp.]
MSDRNNLPLPSLEDCLRAASETEELRLKPDVLEELPAVIRTYYPCTGVCIIADENTYGAVGEKIGAILSAGGIPLSPPLIFPGEPRLHAEYPHVAGITGHIRALPAQETVLPLSAGAGTINDLVKRAAFELQRPYLCIPTAASVDGYTSYGAALLLDGFKQTLPCAAPKVLAADPDILAGAPAYLSSSGFGDLAGKLIAGTDWIIADMAGPLGAPGTEPIDDRAWAMTQTGLRDSLDRSAGAVQKDRDAVRALFEALAITGFAMQYLRSSRPVSGCEHLFSHIWEMEDLSVDGVPVTHGHKVALGTLAASAFTELLFASPEPPFPPGRNYRRPGPGEREAEVRSSFRGLAFKGPGPEEAAVKTALEKLLDEKSAGTLTDALRDTWRDIRSQVLERLLPYGELKALMEKGGCPVLPQTINLSRSQTIAAARRAQMIRNRYTVLDLAWDLGVFEEILGRLEDSEIYLR